MNRTEITMLGLLFPFGYLLLLTERFFGRTRSTSDSRFFQPSEDAGPQRTIRQRSAGWLAIRHRLGRRASTPSSCLTGGRQACRLRLRLSAIGPDPAYLACAEQAIKFRNRTQRLEIGNPAVGRAIAGSPPLHGPHEPSAYSNWAAKLHVDAFLTLPAKDRRGSLIYVG
jgi:hypothetical protein